uniref:WW domain-containing protein n=1 Tax=Alexandrium andersonii TaxID=327968 RepID=A0A7S2HKY5_9DINO
MAPVMMEVWIDLPSGLADQDRYYWNPETNKTQWEKPQGVDIWKEIKQEDNGRPYYWNERTGKTQWERPQTTERSSSPLLDWGNVPSSSSTSVPGDWQFRTAHRGVRVPDALGTCLGGEEADLAELLPGYPEDTHPSNASAWVELRIQQAKTETWVTYYWDYISGTTVEKLPRGVRARWRAWQENGSGDWYYHDREACSRGESKVRWSLPGCQWCSGLGEEALASCRSSMATSGRKCLLEFDAAVCIDGLESAASRRFNGQVGQVIGWFGDAKLIVKLPNALGGPMLAVKPRNLKPLPARTIVMLHNLSQESLNGEVGTVEEDDSKDDCRDVRKHVIKLRLGELKRIQHTRLAPCTGLWNINLQQPPQEWLQWRKEQQCLFIDKSGNHRTYSLHLPLNFSMVASDGSKYVRPHPLLVYMHGAGGSSFFTNSKKSLKSAGLQYAAGKFIIVSPKCDWSWKDVPTPWVNELVEVLRAAWWVDDKRIYLSGCSMGGMSTWEIASGRPDLYAAIAPVAAHHQAEREAMIANALQRMPIFATHSQTDDTCLFSAEEQLWRLLRDNPCLEVALTPDVDHCSMYERAYCDECLIYDWLLKFTK